MNKPNINATVQGASTGNPCTYVTKVLKGNIPLAEQIEDTNTKYVIKWDFDLGGATLTIPEGCLIEMDGGTIFNGTMVGDHTILIYFQELSDCIKSVTMQGTWKYNNPRDGIFTENVYDETQQKTQKQVNSDVAENLGTLDDKIDDKTDINATFSEDGKIYVDFKAGDIVQQIKIANNIYTGANTNIYALYLGDNSYKDAINRDILISNNSGMENEIWPGDSDISTWVLDNIKVLGIANPASLTGIYKKINLESLIGNSYIDTSLSPAKPIWWNGTAWVDATGATV